MAGRYPGVRCVTLDGELGTGFGLTRGGSRRQTEGGRIGKEGQIRELEADIALIETRRTELVREREDLQRDHDGIDLRGLQDDAKAIEKEMTAVEVRMAQVQFEKRRAGEIIVRNREEITSLGAEADRLAGELAEHAPGLERQEAERGEVDRMGGAVSAELEALEADWARSSAAVQELGIRLATIGGGLATAQNDLESSDRRARDTAAAVERRIADLRRTSEESASLQTAADTAARELAGMQEELRSLQERRGAVEQEAARIRRESHAIELRLKDERRSHEESLRSAHELELRIADLTAKAEHVRARAMEEHEVQLQRTAEEGEPVDLTALRDEIQRLRDRIKSLGNINFAAFEEYRGEKDRYEFLSAQRNDLLEAEKTLLATIEEINATAQRKFLETFTQIRANFIETFKSLFDPGDECDLRLEENVDPLEAGIEIIAKPRGKRPTSIDLLSGGEKTLTATALLFAIYLVKPSPFCILDEVDAPLDDANIDRFTRILRKFSTNTQFIVVTHNKRTMEAANALYGVTMEEEGISKLVTVRFHQGAQLQSAALATG
jgi:chromosome segregation protein